jgi:hypothetical protein
MEDADRGSDDLLGGLPRSRPHRRSVHRDGVASARAKSPGRADPKAAAARSATRTAPVEPDPPADEAGKDGGIDVIGAAVGTVEGLLRRVGRRLPGR